MAINRNLIFIIILAVLLCVSFLLNIVLISVIAKNQNILQEKQINQKVLDFRNMFTEKVLLSTKQIDFDTRLEMETAVRALNDKEIFVQWQAFTNSQTQVDATLQAKKLLELLIQKTSQ